MTDSLFALCMIENVHTCLQVDEQQLKKQLEEITVIIQVREKLNTKFPVSHTHTCMQQILMNYTALHDSQCL